MARMILALKLTDSARTGLESLLAQQQDPASSQYHKWLTPEAFGARFGPSQAELDTVADWLRDNGFTVEEVGAGRTSLVFSGDVQRVEQAFQTLILDYRLDGKAFHANAIAPSIPKALAGLVQGVVSLHNLPRRAMNRGFVPAGTTLRPQYTAGSSHYLSPGDFATIYNEKPLFSKGIDGTGVTIAIVGRTHIPPADVTAFRSQFGLPARAPAFVVNGADPGDLGADEDGEANLDVQWAGAVARNAAITFVISKSTGSTDGVDLSAQYIVDHNLAPVMSTSFGQCEATMGASENTFYSNLWAQAAAQGITSFVAAGDSGAAGCSYASASAGSGRAVSGLASTPYNVAVGGTQFADGTGGYWTSASAADGSSAQGYIPEQAWNESGSVAGGSALWATGGGASGLYAKPAWQAARGVPADGRRDLPDVSLSAAGHDGYLIRSGGSLLACGGTSASSPAFAGLMALVVQATGQRQGNPNPVFYQLGNAQYLGTGPAVFHDILTGSNSVPGTAGYLCGAGYDLATGLGSVDAQALVTGWSTGLPNKVTASISAPSASLTVASGTAVAFSGTAQDTAAGASFTFAWDFGDGASGSGAAASHTFTNSGTAATVCTVVFKATDTRGVSGTATRLVTVSPAPRNTVTAAITAPAANLAVASGGAVAFAGSAKDSSASAGLSYSWTFGDGASAAGATASHVFSNPGTASLVCTVTLTAKDSTGITASATRTVTVAPAPRNTVTAAIAAPAANLAVASGAAVAFAGSAKDSSASAALGYNWTFGDGASAAGATASHVFSNTGSASVACTVTFTAKDSTGVTASATRIVTVAPAPRNTVSAAITAPAASLTVASGTAVAFAGSAKDSSAAATLGYNWTFGDGASASGATASHAFVNQGSANVTCTVTLTAYDNTGVTALATRTVTVTPAPAVAALTASITLPAADLRIASGATVQFTGVAVDRNPNPVLNLSWSASVAAAIRTRALVTPVSPTSVCTATFTNTSAQAVTVAVSFLATDNQGGKATATRRVTILPPGVRP